VFERFRELHFLPTFKAWSVRLCIAIVKSDTSRLFGYVSRNSSDPIYSNIKTSDQTRWNMSDNNKLCKCQINSSVLSSVNVQKCTCKAIWHVEYTLPVWAQQNTDHSLHAPNFLHSIEMVNNAQQHQWMYHHFWHFRRIWRWHNEHVYKAKR